MKVIIFAGLVGFFIGFFIGALFLAITLIVQNNVKKSKERLKVSLLKDNKFKLEISEKKSKGVFFIFKADELARFLNKKYKPNTFIIFGNEALSVRDLVKDLLANNANNNNNA